MADDEDTTTTPPPPEDAEVVCHGGFRLPPFAINQPPAGSE